MEEHVLRHLLDGIDREKEEIRDDITEKEALEIYRELIKLFAGHHLSYQCVARLSLAWADAILQGAAELYMTDEDFNY